MPFFCELLRLDICSKECQILNAIESLKALRFDEIPAVKGDEKYRIQLKVTPLSTGPAQKSRMESHMPLGAIVCLRDNTAEILIQAKYSKIQQILTGKEEELRESNTRLQSIRDVLRNRRLIAGE